MTLYRHYFQAPITGSFVSPHEDFETALKDALSNYQTPQSRISHLTKQLGDIRYTLDNIEPVDMPDNPEPV